MYEWIGLGLALVGAGFAAGCGFTALLVKNTEPPPPPLDLDAARTVEVLPEWREQELRQAITETTIDLAAERAEHARWQDLAIEADARAGELRAKVNGLHRFLRAHGHTATEVTRWLKASRKQR